MALALLMAVQAAAASAPAGAAPIAFDLKTHKPAPDPEGECAQQNASDIVVCGRRGQGYRLPALDGRYDEKPLRAEIGIGGGATLRGYIESVEFPNGQVSKRAMIGIKTKF